MFDELSLSLTITRSSAEKRRREKLLQKFLHCRSFRLKCVIPDSNSDEQAPCLRGQAATLSPDTRTPRVQVVKSKLTDNPDVI